MSSSTVITNDFKYPHAWLIERAFKGEYTLKWFQDNWQYGIWICVFYVLAIFGGQHLMRKRVKYDLRLALTIWSGHLALFSIVTASRLIPESMYVIQVHGWHNTICSPTVYYGETAIWAFLFAASKGYELGDTLFIVLRKQPLIFLHWYHHVTVLIYSWYTYGNYYAPGRWFATLNSVVHSFMYTYYFLRAIRIQMPKWVNISITSFQLLQMVVGLLVNVHAYNSLNRGESCHVTHNNIKLSFLMYFTYFLLFAHFFYGTYLKPKASTRKSNVSEQNGHVKHENELKQNGTKQNGQPVNGLRHISNKKLS